MTPLPVRRVCVLAPHVCWHGLVLTQSIKEHARLRTLYAKRVKVAKLRSKLPPEWGTALGVGGSLGGPRGGPLGVSG